MPQAATMFLLAALISIPLSGLAAPVSPPECSIRVLQPVTDDLGNHWTPNQVLPVTIERDTKDGGAFCAHGGSCLPRKVKGQDAVRLLHCAVGPRIDETDHRLLRRR